MTFFNARRRPIIVSRKKETILENGDIKIFTPNVTSTVAN
jgi:hypothetical protein